MHDRADARLCEPSEGERRVQVGIDRWLGIQCSAPQFEILVLRAEANMVQTANMIVRVGEGGHGQQVIAMLARDQGSDEIASHPAFNVPAQLFASRCLAEVLYVEIHWRKTLACHIVILVCSLGLSWLFG